MKKTTSFSISEAEEVARKIGIAWAHLKEFGDYYTRLKIMEDEAEVSHS